MSEPARRQGGVGSVLRTGLLVAWAVGALVTWNQVFDAHIIKGARDYVDRQQLFIDGRGPRQDMRQAMAAARGEATRAAWGWTGVELASGAAVLGVVWIGLRRRAVR